MSSITSPVSIITAAGKIYKLPHLDAMPPLAEDERQRLHDNICRNGIKVPILVTEDDEVLDGHHRLAIAAALGLPAEQIPVRVETGLTAVQRKTLAVTLNVQRRHLTREQVQQMIAVLLTADPAQSDRSLAAKVGVDH